MDEQATIQDYSMIDSFINKSLEDFNKKVFGRYDDKTGYFEEAGNDDESAESTPDNESNEQEQAQNQISEEDLYNMVFPEDQTMNQNQYPDPNQQYDAAGMSSDESPENVSGNVGFKQGVSAEGLSYKATGIVNDLSKIAGNFVVTSGKRSKGENSKLRGSAKNSFHLTGDAIDIRPNVNVNNFLSSPDGQKYLADKGYKIIDERNVKGVGAHWHLEPLKNQKQAGGSIGKQSFNPNLALNDKTFQKWYNTNTVEGKSGVPYSDKLDYDYYSYYRNGDYRNYSGGHFPDTYKRPNHNTFSDESIYSIPENVGGHWTGETFMPSKQQYGGMPIANTKREQYVGLNDQTLDSLYMPLKGINPIRGLDSGEPVHVVDETGNVAVLYGPEDVAYMQGPVKEKRLSKKYKTR